MAERVVHFVLHVPKCAGTTVEAHFAATLGEGFLRAPRWEHPLRNVIGNRYPYAPGDPRLDAVRLVSGHSLSRSLAAHFPGCRIEESVLIRDPLGYFLSFYNYRWTRHRAGREPRPPRFETWYRAQRLNPISRFLLNRYFEQGVPAIYRLSSAGRLAFLEARLARFLFVGAQDRADEMIAGLSKALGVPGQGGRRNVTSEKVVREEELGARLTARIRAENALDEVLFQRWKDRGWRNGAPPPPARPGLSDRDQPRYLAADMASGLLKKLIR